MTASAKQWPNLFIVGAAKAGTTSLYRYLGQHPDIYMSPMKEPHFFSHIEPDPKLASFFPHIDDVDGYLALFARASGAAVRGEASTSYLSHPDVPTAVRAVSPEAKIVIMLRDPVTRAYSNYWNNVREGFENRSFEQAIREEAERPGGRWGVDSLYIDAGLYTSRTSRYLDVFGERVLVLFFEEFIRQPRDHLMKTLAFLGVEPSVSNPVEFDAYNALTLPKNALSGRVLASPAIRSAARRLLPRSARAYGRRLLLAPASTPQMGSDTRQTLLEIYRRDVEDLAGLLGRRPPWPNFEPPTDG